ncbi:MAG: efflux RND transporter periplasmic adaptor subunit [Candidatus Eisenbacteria bacterium]|nr:efflux RND transporter periplasmic adaptor subunit [Candidatus Eisenbacteria bacterium]
MKIPGRTLVATALLAALAGCGPRGGGFQMPPTPVEVAEAKVEGVTDRFEAVGTLEAAEQVTLVSEIDASVVGISYREGETVRRGGLIAQLDDSQLRAEVNRAEALRVQGSVAFARVKSIVEQNAGSQQDLDNAAAALKVAEANLDVAKARLAKTRIVAPFDGRVGARRVSQGAFLRSGQPIADIAQLSELRVKFSAPERYLGVLRQGAPVTVSTPAVPGSEVRGRIDVIDPVLDPGTRNARITARIANPGGRFLPGMSANVSVVLAARPAALTVPSEAVFEEGDQSVVYVVQPDSTVLKTNLTLGSRQAGAVEVVKGLEAGALVVRAGHQKLFPGAKVMPMTAEMLKMMSAGGPPGGKPGAGAPGKPGGAPAAGSKTAAPGKAAGTKR